MKPISKNTYQTLQANWPNFANNKQALADFEQLVLPHYLPQCRWFGGKGNTILTCELHQIIPFNCDEDKLVYFILIDVNYSNAALERYMLPIANCKVQDIEKIDNVPVVICMLSDKSYIADAVYCNFFRTTLFTSFLNESNLAGADYQIKFSKGLKFEKPIGGASSRVLSLEQSNTSILFNEQYFFKLFRKVEYVLNPDFEIIKFLSEQTNFTNIPVFQASIELKNKNGSMLLGMLQKLCPNQGDAWTLMQAELVTYFKSITQNKWHIVKENKKLQFENVPEVLNQLIGLRLFVKITLLAKRTAQLHIALASNNSVEEFKPLDFNEQYKQELFSEMEQSIHEKFNLLQNNLDSVPISIQPNATLLLSNKDKIIDFFRKTLNKQIKSKITRIHGDYHLGQVLFTGSDFVLLDFEGEPGKSYALRRAKHSPLKDVAGMLRSFSYAAYASLYTNFNNDTSTQTLLEPWAKEWSNYTGRLFIDAYFEEMKSSNHHQEKEDLLPLIQLFLFEKAIYELGYEINNRKHWVAIPLTGALQFVNNYLHD